MIHIYMINERKLMALPRGSTIIPHITIIVNADVFTFGGLNIIITSHPYALASLVNLCDGDVP